MFHSTNFLLQRNHLSVEVQYTTMTQDFKVNEWIHVIPVVVSVAKTREGQLSNTFLLQTQFMNVIIALFYFFTGYLDVFSTTTLGEGGGNIWIPITAEIDY